MGNDKDNGGLGFLIGAGALGIGAAAFGVKKIHDVVVKRKAKSYPDGIIDRKYYNNAHYKIAWVLKEANNKGNGPLDIRKYLHDYRPVNDLTPRRVALTCAGINDTDCDDTYELDCNSDYVRNQLLSIAWININKEGGSSTTDSKRIKEYYAQNKNTVFNQIYEADPEIIIFGGTFWLFWDDLKRRGANIKKLDFHYFDSDCYCYVDVNNSNSPLYIETDHPSHTRKWPRDNDYSSDIVEAVRAWEEGNYELIDSWSDRHSGARRN